MKFIKKYWSLAALAACIAAALVFRRFTYVAWYPVMMSLAVASGFALSLLGDESLCLTMAKKIPPYIMPEGAESYCKKYTIFWAAWLCINAIIAVGTIYAPGAQWHLEKAGIDVPVVWIAWNCCLSYCATGIIIVSEMLIRRKRFSIVFHTSGSTAKPKKIVKTFRSLALEVAYHHKQFVERGILPKSTGRDPDEKVQSAEFRVQNETGRDPVKPVFLSTIEPHHMYGQLWRVLLPRVGECPQVNSIILTPEELLGHMRASEKVFLVTTPSFLNRFCAYADQYDIPQNCVEIITSGALLDAATSAATKKVFGIAPLEIFGSTETGGVACRRQTGRDPDRKVQSAEFRAQNETGRDPDGKYDWKVFEPVKVSVSEEGRLVVNSPFSFKKNFEMGDGVELSPDGRSFKLLGRRDRLVKIAEQRVSLPEMEEKMLAFTEVKEVALAALDGVHGKTLGAVIVLNRDAVDIGKGKSVIALELRKRCIGIFPKGTVPKKYRFVMELPRNAQGKVQTAMLRKILETNLVEPFVKDVVTGEDAWSADLVFDAGAPYFKGHFPSFAVLPGVVQLGLAQHFAESFIRRPFVIKAVKKMKFTRVIVPGEEIRLKLVKKGDNEIIYEYKKGENSCSSGILSF